MSGWEFVSNRLFSDAHKAIKLLKYQGYKLMDDEENLFYKTDSRAVLVERVIE